MILTSFRYSGQLDQREALVKQIYALEAEIAQLPQVDCPVFHHFSPGRYVREMRIPPWTVLSGAVHLTDHPAMLVEGQIEVLTDEGLRLLTAPCAIPSRAGIKRIGRTFGEGATWLTWHANPDDCRDMDVLVPRLCTSQNSELLHAKFAALQDGGEKCLLG